MVVRACLGCDRLTSNGSRCEDCRLELVRRRSAARGTRQQQGYDAAWQRTVAAAIRAQPWCSICKHPGSRDNPLTGDHILPKSRGGGNEPGNVRVLCRSCNSARGNRDG